MLLFLCSGCLSNNGFLYNSWCLSNNGCYCSFVAGVCLITGFYKITGVCIVTDACIVKTYLLKHMQACSCLVAGRSERDYCLNSFFFVTTVLNSFFL